MHLQASTVVFWISCPCTPELFLAVSWAGEVDYDQPCRMCLSVHSIRIYGVRVLEMPQQVKVLAAKPDEAIAIPRQDSHGRRREVTPTNLTFTLRLSLPLYFPFPCPPQTCEIHKKMKKFKEYTRLTMTCR